MKINVIADINNMPTKPITKHGYLVARQDITTGHADLWYWGFYEDKDRANQAAVEIGNGVVLETAPIILRSKLLLKAEQMKQLRDDYLKQAATGVVIINDYIEPIYPNGIDCEDCPTHEPPVNPQEPCDTCRHYENGCYWLPSVTPQESKYCDRNICISNEYNGIGCNECEVTKSQEPKTEIEELDFVQEHKRIPVTLQVQKYCDRNICISNEYNGIGCDECEVTKSREPKTGHWILDETDNSITCDKCGCLIWANDISNGDAQ